MNSKQLIVGRAAFASIGALLLLSALVFAQPPGKTRTAGLVRTSDDEYYFRPRPCAGWPCN